MLKYWVTNSQIVHYKHDFMIVVLDRQYKNDTKKASKTYYQIIFYYSTGKHFNKIENLLNHKYFR